MILVVAQHGPRETMVYRDDSPDSGLSVAATIRADLLSQVNGQIGFSFPSWVWSLQSQQLGDTVRETLNNANAQSTCANYGIKWKIFSEWCLGN